MGDPAGEKNQETSPNLKSENDLEPVEDDESNGGQVVPVLKVEDVEVTGVAEEEDAEVVAKPPMSKVASMKRDLSFGRLQKMFSREAKSEHPQQQQEDAEIPATDEEEKLKTGEGKGEDIESRVTGLKRSLMKMFARESESEGATANETSALAETEKEEVEDVKEGEEEASPKKMSSLKKRLSFKAMRSKFSKEKKDACEDHNDEKKETDAGKESHEKKMENEKEENDTKEGDTQEKEEEVTIVETTPTLVGVKVNLDEGEAEAEPTSPTNIAPAGPEELKQSVGADPEVEDKQLESVVQEHRGSEKGQTELETSGTESSKGE